MVYRAKFADTRFLRREIRVPSCAPPHATRRSIRWILLRSPTYKPSPTGIQSTEPSNHKSPDLPLLLHQSSRPWPFRRVAGVGRFKSRGKQLSADTNSTWRSEQSSSTTPVVVLLTWRLQVQFFISLHQLLRLPVSYQVLFFKFHLIRIFNYVKNFSTGLYYLVYTDLSARGFHEVQSSTTGPWHKVYPMASQDAGVVGTVRLWWSTG